MIGKYKLIYTSLEDNTKGSWYFYLMMLNIFAQDQFEFLAFKSSNWTSFLFELIFTSTNRSLSSDRCSEAGEHRLFVDKPKKIWAVINGLSTCKSPVSVAWNITICLEKTEQHYLTDSGVRLS